ncbi:MAG: helix-turn-helix transcriptional regulator [Victivallales bacterium]|nr:helix-turn-helix transcriptional regulator [Victivallales bacterium]
MFFPLTPEETMQDLAQKAKSLRLEANLTRAGLASRSGVSSEPIKRFENTDQISLKSLLNLAQALRRIADFENIFSPPDVRDHYLPRSKKFSDKEDG